VLAASNAMAILIQSLSAKPGIASGMTLPEAIRETTSPAMRAALRLAVKVFGRAPRPYVGSG
jgi:Mn2+/Fe2+ NRAMP family transporter